MLDILFIAFILLQVFDLYSTRLTLDSGKAHEANPLVAWLIYLIGLIPALMLKTAFSCSLGTWLYVHDQTEILAALTAFYGYFMYQNYKVLNGRK